MKIRACTCLHILAVGLFFLSCADAQDIAQTALPAISRAAGQSNGIIEVGFSSDGKLAFSADRNQTVILWDGVTRKELRRFFGGKPCFSSDGRYLITILGERTMTNRETSTGAISITLSATQTVHVWDTRSGDLLHAFDGYVAIFSPDGANMLIAYGVDSVSVRNTVTGDAWKSFPAVGSIVTSLHFSRDGKLAVVRTEQSLSAWELIGDGYTYIHSFTVAPGGVGNEILAVSNNGDRMLVVQDPGLIPISGVFLNDVKSGNVVSALEGPINRVDRACFAPDDGFIVTISDLPDGAAGPAPDPTLIVWDAANGHLLCAPYVNSPAREHDAVCFSRDGKRMLASSREKEAGASSLQLWELPSGKLLHTFDTGKTTVTAAALSPDGSVAFIGSAEGSLRFLDTGVAGR